VKLWWATLSLVAVASGAAAQVPAGGEFLINETTLGPQLAAIPALRPDGDFVVAWSHRDPQSLYDVLARRFSSTGSPQGGEFRVNTYTTATQGPHSVAVDRRGRFVIVWASDLQDGSRSGVFGQRYDTDGQPLGVEFRVNAYTNGSQARASVAKAPEGGFVVTWASEYQDGNVRGVFARRYDAAGNPLGAEFQVNSYVTNSQEGPAVAVAEDGRFVIVWESYGQDGDNWDVFGQRYDASGLRSGPEFRVNEVTTAFQDAPAIGISAGASFVVVWRALDGGAQGLFARRFDATGSPAGAEFAVNSYTTGSQIGGPSSVSSDAAGNFVVTWQSTAGDGSDSAIIARRFDSQGNPRSPEFRVNTYTTGFQLGSSLSSDPVGNFVITWGSQLQDGSDRGAFGQRFGGLLPAALDVDAPGGNRVLEPGESVDVRPSWRNVNGASQTFASGAVAFTGPPGATYAITDGVADYGTVANGATARCSDCLGVTVSNPASRPTTHWDTVLEEKISPDAQGQHKRWRLHVGTSFGDVPAANPFYRFVETLLHNGVTGGCTSSTYCPVSATTREQMAVFVLVAKEGAGYVPPACGTTPVFGDVPSSSAFCPWVEELARRGVVTGCGGGNYCPSAPVARDEMAVFVLRTFDPAMNPPACAPPNLYGDVPENSAFCRWVEELTNRAVVTGCGGGNYCPALAVTREQMGVFIGVTFGLALYGP
jgi:hypothetical protein